jgi:hypothetical protein
MNVQSTDPGLRFSDDDENMMMEDPEAQELDADFGSLAKPPSFFCIPEYRRQLIISIVFFSSGLGLIIYAMANFAWENSTFGLVALLLGVLLTLPGGSSQVKPPNVTHESISRICVLVCFLQVVVMV